MKRLIVAGLDHACDLTHFVTLHRPWLWAFHHCPLAMLAIKLDDHWQTGRWGAP